MPRCVYVSLGGEGKILIYDMDPDTGGLTQRSDVAVDGSPGSLGVDPSGRTLYAALRSTESVSAFRIDPADGSLKLLGTTPVGFNPVFVGTDRSGRFLLTSSYNAGKVAVFGIDPDGTVRDGAADRHDTAEHAHSIWVDPSNRFVYVPHTAPPNAIYQFRFDATTGGLTPVEPPTVVLDTVEGPRHMAFHPTLEIAYSVNENGSSVTALSIDTAAGALSPVQTLSTLPEDFDGDNACADIIAHPNGRHVYATNRGHDSIACYSIDAGDGTLTSIGNQPTEATPRAFGIDPDGAYIISAGQSSGRLATYRIEQSSGQLRPLETYEAGESPSWVLALDLG